MTEKTYLELLLFSPPPPVAGPPARVSDRENQDGLRLNSIRNCEREAVDNVLTNPHP
jgi:hypothetical protein